MILTWILLIQDSISFQFHFTLPPDPDDMQLLDLPTEILCSLPRYIHDIESFTNAASSCRQLRDAFSHARPNTILRLAAGSAPTFFSPHPYFLVALTARRASDWVLGNADRTQLLRQAMREGIFGLYEFCLDHSSLTLEDIRQSHLARFSTINPLSDKVDKMAGKQWLDTPDFWNGGVSEPATLCAEPDRATMQIIIYGELFGQSMEAFLEPEKNLPYFDIATRLDYLAYCVPDSSCASYPGFELLPVGPYALRANARTRHTNLMADGEPSEDQVVLHHILRCSRWRRMWAAAIRSIQDSGDKFTNEDEGDEDWRKKLYRDALQTQGLAGMHLLRPRDQIPAECVEKARRMAAQIAALERPPGYELIGERHLRAVSFAPNPGMELVVTLRSYWGA